MTTDAMGRKPVTYSCSRCEGHFNSKQALDIHLRDHRDVQATWYQCPVCSWPFGDSLALENHRIQNNHLSAALLDCDRCTEAFATPKELLCHREHGKPCCDAFHSMDWKKHPKPGYVDPDKPNQTSKQVQELEYDDDSLGTPSDISGGQEYCHYCKKTFASPFAYDRHLLGCTALNMKLTPDSPSASPGSLYRDQDVALPPPAAQRHTVTIQVPPLHAHTSTAHDHASASALETMTLKTKAPVPRQQLPTLSKPQDAPSIQQVQMRLPHFAPAPAPSQALGVQPTRTGRFVCNVSGCQRGYNSEQGLKMHETDTHGIGGKGLDLHGKDSWMLGQRTREQLKAKGLLRAPTNPSRGSKNNRSGSRGGRAAPFPVAARTTPFDLPVQRGPPPLPTSQNVGGALEMEQAKFICAKTLRLLLQTDIFIHHDGRMSVGGIDWTRIGVERQSDVVGMFDKMCHLPRKLQTLEYVPAPKTFLSEYNAQYPVTEFESAPARDSANSGTGVIAMACSKVILKNGRHEVVKIAAVDVLTCRVLMSHLVCTDPNVLVANWNSAVTGLTSFKDLEGARQAGYKVFRGWSAARSALFKFIDRDTIIVGHNLRSELDALRIVHGRAVDIAKVVEKAAQGALSKVQVSLDSWCRDVANVARLKTDPIFGRDCVMNAFAAREIGLWSIKNQEKFEKVAKQKTKEYHLVMNA